MVVGKHQVQETAGAIEETGALPPGWVKLQVRSSGIEYYRHEDGQVLWKRPTHDKNDTSLFSPIGALGKPEGQAPLVTPGTPSFLSPTGHTKPTPARTHWSPPPPTPAGGQTRPGSAQEDGPLSEKQIAEGWKRCISCAPYPSGPCVLWQAPMYAFRSWAIELKDALPHALFVILAQVRIALAGAGLLQKSCDGPDAVDASECSGMPNAKCAAKYWNRKLQQRSMNRGAWPRAGTHSEFRRRWQDQSRQETSSRHMGRCWVSGPR